MKPAKQSAPNQFQRAPQMSSGRPAASWPAHAHAQSGQSDAQFNYVSCNCCCRPPDTVEFKWKLEPATSIVVVAAPKLNSIVVIVPCSRQLNWPRLGQPKSRANRKRHLRAVCAIEQTTGSPLPARFCYGPLSLSVQLKDNDTRLGAPKQAQSREPLEWGVGCRCCCCCCCCFGAFNGAN